MLHGSIGPCQNGGRPLWFLRIWLPAAGRARRIAVVGGLELC
jgi:hypothetical protein